MTPSTQLKIFGSLMIVVGVLDFVFIYLTDKKIVPPFFSWTMIVGGLVSLFITTQFQHQKKRRR